MNLRTAKPITYLHRPGGVRTLALGLTLICTATLFGSAADIWIKVALGLITVAAAAALAWIVGKWLRGRPALVLDGAGLTIDGMLRRRQVPWTNVGWIERNAGEDGPDRLILYEVQSLSDAPVMLTPAHLGTTAAELEQQLRRFLPDVRITSGTGETLIERHAAREREQNAKDAEFHARTQRAIDKAARAQRPRI